MREADKNAERTLGIITKPDTLPKGSPSESSFLTLAQNKDVRFELGWHVLRNRSYEERDTTSEERDLVEAKFFSQGVWQTLNSKNKGVATLRVRLSKVLHDHILAELPSLLKEVDSAIGECETRLKALGSSRATLEEQKIYLVEASHHFTTLISQAVSGNYQDSFFGSSSTESGYLRRLRAVAKSILTEFEREMRMNGHAVELVETISKHYKHIQGTPRKMTPKDYYKQVEFQMVRNAGTELPGFMNPRIIKDLFFDQSAPWTNIIQKTKAELLFATHTTIAHALEASADDTTISGILRDIINPHMAAIEDDLDQKVHEILDNLRDETVTLNRKLSSSSSSRATLHVWCADKMQTT